MAQRLCSLPLKGGGLGWGSILGLRIVTNAPSPDFLAVARKSTSPQSKSDISDFDHLIMPNSAIAEFGWRSIRANECSPGRLRRPTSPFQGEVKLWLSRSAANCLTPAPRHQRPQALVQVINNDLGKDLGAGDGAGQTGMAGNRKADNERVQAAGYAPAHRLRNRARV